MEDKGPEVSFEEIDPDFLSRSQVWFLDREFRDLIMAQPIDPQSQLRWYGELKHRSDYKIWGVKAVDRGWVGAFGIKQIEAERGRAEYWGYLYPPDLRGHGIGRRMFSACKGYGSTLGIKSFWLKVSTSNLEAQAAYLRWGFRVTGESDSDVIYMVCEI